MITEFIPKKFRKPLKYSQLVEANISERPHIVHSRKCPLVIGPMSDPVFRYMLNEFADQAHFVCWENFGTLWSYRSINGHIDLVCGSEVHKVSGFYLRSYESCGSDENSNEMVTFLKLMTASLQNRMGTIDLGISNTSKILHLHSAVKEACSGLKTIAIPETLMIKSKDISSHGLAMMMGPSVAKSLSSTRTQVFDDEAFKHFKRHRPAHVPVLIQKKKRGMEVRVHCVNGELFPLGIRNNQGGVDYRYSDDIELVHDVQLSEEEIEFCHRIQKIEGNPLIGVDFIRDSDMTYCFEANPNPGWASFDYSQGLKRSLGNAIINYLYQ